MSAIFKRFQRLWTFKKPKTEISRLITSVQNFIKICQRFSLSSTTSISLTSLSHPSIPHTISPLSRGWTLSAHVRHDYNISILFSLRPDVREASVQHKGRRPQASSLRPNSRSKSALKGPVLRFVLRTGAFHSDELERAQSRHDFTSTIKIVFCVTVKLGVPLSISSNEHEAKKLPMYALLYLQLQPVLKIMYLSDL